MRKYDVVALGELLVDFTQNGMSQNGNMIFEANPGGAPCNVLSMLQNLGRSTAFIGKVGRDFLGDMLVEAVKEKGISAEGIVYDNEIATTLAFVHTKEDGDRDFSFYRNPGADVRLCKTDIDIELVRNAKIFHFGSLSMTDKECEAATGYAIEEAKKAGVLISFDPNLRIPLWRSQAEAKEKIAFGMSQCDILKISDNEISFMTGEENIDKGIAQLQKQYSIPFICATMGKQGSKAFFDGKAVRAEAVLTENTIDTTGAGDTFCGCMLNYILNAGIINLDAESVEEMLQFANAAASIITTRKGALRVMPEEEEIHTLLKKH